MAVKIAVKVKYNRKSITVMAYYYRFFRIWFDFATSLSQLFVRVTFQAKGYAPLTVEATKYMSNDAELILIGDRKAAGKSALQPKFEYQPTAGDYRDTLAKTSTTLAESDNFQFQNLKLPDGKALLRDIKEISKEMGAQPMAIGVLSDGSRLQVEKNKGHVTAATIMLADGSLDSAKFDEKMRVQGESLLTPLGSRAREYRADNSIASEANIVPSTDGTGKPAYVDLVEFDKKGHVTHSHCETATDIKDDKRLPDGSGLVVVDHKDPDLKKAFIDTTTTKNDGSIVEDKKFGNGDFAHLEIDSHGVTMRLDQSDVSRGLVQRQQRQTDGEVEQFTDRLI